MLEYTDYADIFLMYFVCISSILGGFRKLHEHNPNNEIDNRKPEPISSRSNCLEIVRSKMRCNQCCNSCPYEMSWREIEHRISYERSRLVLFESALYEIAKRMRKITHAIIRAQETLDTSLTHPIKGPIITKTSRNMSA